MSLFNTTLSVNLDIKDRIQTGRKFFMRSLSNEGFVSKGVTSAAFIFVGTIPVDMDKLTMCVVHGRNSLNVPSETRSHRIE